MKYFTENAPAKINLFLHVTGKRPDKYHDLESLVAFSHDIVDRIHFRPLDIEGIEFTVRGEFRNDIPKNADNLVIKAIQHFEHRTGIKITGQLALEKHLPVSAGIGGGSSDAAAIIRLLTKLYKIREPELLYRSTLKLGSDLPVCIRASSSFVQGVGETIEPMPEWPPVSIVLVNPRIPVHTKEVFGALDVPFTPPLFENRIPPPEPEKYFRWLWQFSNTLQDTAIKICPEIQIVLRSFVQIKGCKLARLSGSGATCFGLFENDATAEKGVQQIKTAHPEWWVMRGSINNHKNNTIN